MKSETEKMALLHDLREWSEWAEEQGIKNQPERFPCFAFEVVLSWGWEESGGAYLYAEDIAIMQQQITQ